MRYKWFRSRGLFVGSGIVEASCKTIIAQRLEQAGMPLDHRQAPTPSSPCAAAKPASTWEAICSTINTQTRTA